MCENHDVLQMYPDLAFPILLHLELCPFPGTLTTCQNLNCFLDVLSSVSLVQETQSKEAQGKSLEMSSIFFSWPAQLSVQRNAKRHELSCCK